MNMNQTEKCFDDGMIQAFLDGEMASDLSEKVACHLAMCDNCSMSLAAAEEESAFAFAALDAELNALVPTERIRTRLFETIAAEKKSFWQRIFGEGFRWTNPSVAAFASLVLVIGLFATLWIARENSLGSNEIAANRTPQSAAKNSTVAETKPPIPNNLAESAPDNIESVPFNEVQPTEPEVRRVAAKPRNETRFVIQKANYKPEVKNPVTPYTPPVIETSYEAVTGEESYLKTIATLKQTVDSRKDELMRPSMRVAFERDMAVVDDAIKKMQVEVRKNPKNEAAKEVLRSSYQNKIDLLNSVAEKGELMATVNKSY